MKQANKRGMLSMEKYNEILSDEQKIDYLVNKFMLINSVVKESTGKLREAFEKSCRTKITNMLEKGTKTFQELDEMAELGKLQIDDTKTLYDMLPDEQKRIVDEEFVRIQNGTRELKAFLQACKEADE